MICVKMKLHGELGNGLFKTGGRQIYWQEQFEDFKADQILRTVSDFDYFSSEAFLVLS